MTEDDTFKKLRQLPYRDLRATISKNLVGVNNREEESRIMMKCVEDNGWTGEEFMEEMLKDAEANMARLAKQGFGIQKPGLKL